MGVCLPLSYVLHLGPSEDMNLIFTALGDGAVRIPPLL
jgi:hypothetical protein